MSGLEDIVMVLSSFLGMLILLAMLNIFYKLWWTPTRLQSLMGLQGIKGPSYTFIHGSTKEILRMEREAIDRPIGLSHAIFSKAQPHVDSWINFLMYVI